MTETDRLKGLADRLLLEGTLPPEDLRSLLLHHDGQGADYLHGLARQTARKHFGNRIFIRGLVEIGNCCHNDCLYCGIRRSNRHVERYRLDRQTILECCRTGYEMGFRTFVLQGGEDPWMHDERTATLVSCLRQAFPDAAITLSLGEKTVEAYRRFFEAGANRYLLRHETHNPAHYALLHPASMSLDHRLHCLEELKRIGYQTGTGIMVGSPGQTADHLVEDIRFIHDFRPHMIGIGPFIPHHDTPFAHEPAGSVELTLRLISIFRLMHPAALIPATTALASLSPDGRERGILAGANVVMPNLSPLHSRAKYALYDNKASLGAEAAEGLALLDRRLAAIGYRIDKGRGDYDNNRRAGCHTSEDTTGIEAHDLKTDILCIK